MDTIKRTSIDNRHKVAWLQKKNRKEFLYYLIDKGIEYNRCILKRNYLGSSTQYYVLRLNYYINGYYCYVDIIINEDIIDAAINWTNDNIKEFVNSWNVCFDGSGISIENKWVKGE